MVITSRSNPQIKELIKLNDKKFRTDKGLYLVEGIKPVCECISAGCVIDKIICTEKYALKFDNPIVVSDGVFGVFSSEKTPQGVIATVKIPQNELKEPSGSCLLLDCLQDPGNIGTIIRTANAAGYRQIYMINCADPYSPKAVRASMSGIFFVEIIQGAKEDILKLLGNIPIICANMQGENLFDFVPPEKFCLCIGNEGAGLSREIKEHCSYSISIPMADTCESLNAAVAAGIAMYTLKDRNLK